MRCWRLAGVVLAVLAVLAVAVLAVAVLAVAVLVVALLACWAVLLDADVPAGILRRLRCWQWRGAVVT